MINNSTVYQYARKRSALIAAGVIMSICAVSTTAYAAYGSIDAVGGPASIEVFGADAGSGNPGYIAIWAPGGPYFAQPNSPCAAVAAQTVETINRWTSLAQATILSGKTLTIRYNECTFGSATHRYIHELVLQK